MSIIEGVLRGSGIRLGPTAQVFVVDPVNGPYMTMQAAIDDAVDHRGDVILRMRGTETVTQAINFNKSGIRVLAVGPTMSPLAQGEYHAILADVGFTDGPVAIFTADRCWVEGLGFVSRDTGATFFSGAAVLIGGGADANPFGVILKSCRFPKWNVSNRIGVAIEGSSNCLIEDCDFEGVGADFAAGIYVQGATQNLVVRKNHFRSCTYAIEHGAFAGGGPHCMYLENICEDAKLLKAGGNAATGLIARNLLETATDTGSYDDTIANLKTLGLNFSGNQYSE